MDSPDFSMNKGHDAVKHRSNSSYDLCKTNEQPPRCTSKEHIHLNNQRDEQLSYRFILLSCSLPVTTIICGVFFYKFVNEWDISTSIFFAVQTLTGNMYNTPSEETFASKFFTMAYRFWGICLIGGAIGVFASLVVDRVNHTQKRLAVEHMKVEVQQEGVVISTNVAHCRSGMRWFISMYCRKKFWPKIGIVAMASSWFLVGALYARLIEADNWLGSFYFALGLISGAGMPSPNCLEGTNGPGCRLGSCRALFLAAYLVIGVPIFLMLMGQFSTMIVEAVVLDRERRRLKRPITPEEFEFACELSGKNSMEDNFNGINFHEFLLLELLRLRRVDQDDIEEIKSLFDQFDTRGIGLLHFPAEEGGDPSRDTHTSRLAGNDSGTSSSSGKELSPMAFMSQLADKLVVPPYPPTHSPTELRASASTCGSDLQSSVMSTTRTRRGSDAYNDLLHLTTAPATSTSTSTSSTVVQPARTSPIAPVLHKLARCKSMGF